MCDTSYTLYMDLTPYYTIHPSYTIHSVLYLLVFINYGEKSNADLLLLYGFSLDRNPFNAGMYIVYLCMYVLVWYIVYIYYVRVVYVLTCLVYMRSIVRLTMCVYSRKTYVSLYDIYHIICINTICIPHVYYTIFLSLLTSHMHTRITPPPVDISVGVSKQDPLYSQKMGLIEKQGRGATSVRFPLQDNRYGVLGDMYLYVYVYICMLYV